jgi:diaminopimelate epimerase
MKILDIQYSQNSHIAVQYMSGAGNLFTVVNNTEYRLEPEVASTLAPTLCSQIAIKDISSTEGLMIIRPSDEEGVDFHVDYFNPDGSTSMMCGNGARCAVRFAQYAQIIESMEQPVVFRMAGELYQAISSLHDIPVRFPPPIEWLENLVLTIEDVNRVPVDVEVAYVNVGSDHCVIHEEELVSAFQLANAEYSFDDIAPRLRNHPAFVRGANVNVYTIDGEDRIRIRTFERGVEAVTGACGTGALATAFIAWKNGQTSSVVELIPPSGEMLFVILSTLSSPAGEESIQAMTLAGPAVFLGDGVVRC